MNRNRYVINCLRLCLLSFIFIVAYIFTTLDSKATIVEGIKSMASSPEHPKESEEKDRYIPNDFPNDTLDHIGDWAKNKTILLIGDSVDRRTTEWICRYKNWTLSIEDLSNVGWKDCHNYNGCPRVCTSADFNITVVNAFTVGLNPDDFLRPRTLGHFPADQAMDPNRRILEVYLPFLRDILKRNPDMVVFNSGLWDLMDWTRQFVKKNVSATNFDVVTDERLSQYKQQLDDYASFLAKLFPDSQLLWRELPSSPEGRDQAWGLMDIPNYKVNGEAKMFRNSYLDSLNIAANKLLEKNHPGIISLPWNKATRGKIGWVDDVHPNGEAYKVVVNMWLYFLKFESQYHHEKH